MLQFDDFKKCYGEILYRWGLREKRADVLKFASCPPEPHKGIGTFNTHSPADVFKDPPVKIKLVYIHVVFLYDSNVSCELVLTLSANPQTSEGF